MAKTNEEIKDELRNIDTLIKAEQLCICDEDLVIGLNYKIATKMRALLKSCLTIKRHSNLAIRELNDKMNKIDDLIDDENECMYDDVSAGTVWGWVSLADTVIKVMVLED